MIISVINCTSGAISDERVQQVIRAVNRQIKEDFQPNWHIGGTLRLEGLEGAKPNKQNLSSMRGDAIIYLWDQADIDNALGYHDLNHRGIPYGFVFTQLSRALNEPWSVTFSHEVLELLGDRNANQLIKGPHPDPEQNGRSVYHWHEMCDAVQNERYQIDGEWVSNFVLPLYFSPENEPGSRNDFLNHRKNDKFLTSFGVKPGGYVGFYDPELNGYTTFLSPAEGSAEKRHKIKSQLFDFSRINRNQDLPDLLTSEESKSISISEDETESELVLESKNKILITTESGVTLHIQEAKGVMSLNCQFEENARQRRMEKTRLEQQHQQFCVLCQENGWSEVAAVEMSAASGSAQKSINSVKLKLVNSSTRKRASSSNEIMIAALVGSNFTHYYFVDANEQFELPVLSADAAGPRASALGITRRFVRFITVKTSHFLSKADFSGMTQKLLKYVANKVENGIKKEQLLQFKEVKQSKLSDSFFRLEPAKKLKKNSHYLLFIHGIISSIAGAFGHLLNPIGEEDQATHVLTRLKSQNKYDAIIGFDHHTLSKSVMENVALLINLLPEDCTFDIICHSRGGAICRLLLENPQNIKQLTDKNIAINKVLFVAGANQGSALANAANIDKFINVASSLSLPHSGFGMGALVGLIAQGLKSLPGLSDMRPDASVFKAMTAKTYAKQYAYMRADFDPRNRFIAGLDELVIDQLVFNGAENDVVVPFEGAGFVGTQNSATDLLSFGKGKERNDAVWHIRFFDNWFVRGRILDYFLMPESRAKKI